MARVVLAFRMLVGLSMVAGGVVLVTPLASRLVTAASARGRGGASDVREAAAVADGSSSEPRAAVVPAGVESPIIQPPVGQPPAVWPQAAWSPPAELPVAVAPAGGMTAAEPPFPEPPSFPRDYRPPPPPPPLGAASQEFALPQPGMPDLYRAAHGAPPPPLLDGPRSEPGIAAVAVEAASAPPQTWQYSAADAPRSSYRVRDGDDLVGIAARVYGHPAAARAVWEANRDRLADPGLLPIGLELRLPAPWEIDPHSAPSATAIEPRRSAAAATTWSGPERSGDPAAPWLGSSAPAATPAAWPGPQSVAPPAGSRVVVAPGETLVSLAQRLYGDPLVARRIWEANRDRLRSPDLLVPGMELRLP